MAVRAFDLFDIDQIKDELGGIAGTGQDSRLERVALRVTDIIEGYVNRPLIDRGANITEYHSIPDGLRELYPLVYPVSSVVSLHEDPSLVYDAATLVPTTGYTLFPGDPEGKQRAKIQRSYGEPWLAGWHYVRLVYRGGFANRAALPGAILDVALELGAIMYRVIERKTQGIVERTDLSGAVQRFQSRSTTISHLSEQQQDQLQPWVRVALYETGERAA